LFRNPILDSIPNVAFMASPATIASKGDAIARYSRALVEAALFIHYNTQASARFFLQAAGQKVTPEAIDTTSREIAYLQSDLPAADPSNMRIGYLDPKGVTLLCRFLYAAGLTSQLVPTPAVSTNQFIAFANDFDHRAVIRFAKTIR
jgi:ABC-type nitrate/sulfonate/bicarbonate transport system substrate-binding protein